MILKITTGFWIQTLITFSFRPSATVMWSGRPHLSRRCHSSLQTGLPASTLTLQQLNFQERNFPASLIMPFTADAFSKLTAASSPTPASS